MNEEFQRLEEKPIKASVDRLVKITIALYVIIGILVVFVGGLSIYTFNSNKTTKDAICSLRADLQSRADAGKQFLKDNPNGVPGIPAQVLKDSIKNQQRTVDALSGIDC